MEDPGFCSGAEESFLSDEIDAWVSFTVEDPAFTENPGNLLGTDVPETTIPISETPLLQNPASDEGDFCGLLLDDFDLPENILTTGTEPLQPPLGSSEVAVASTAATLPPVKLNPHIRRVPGQDLLASPPRSTSSYSDGQGESFGSNNGKSPDVASNADASSCPGGSSSDGDHGTKSGVDNLRAEQVKTEPPPTKLPGGFSTTPLGPASSLAAPLGTPGFQGGFHPMVSTPVAFQGYPTAPNGAPLLFRPMVPFSRSLPRRQRKSSAGSKGQGQVQKQEAGRKASSKEGRSDAKESLEEGDWEAEGTVKEVKCEPGSSPSPQSGVSTEEGRERHDSLDSDDGGSSDEDGGPRDADWEKKQARLIRNRESAQLSRQRKKFYMEELEGQLRTMSATIAELNNTVAHLSAENVNLRRQLAYFCPNGTAPPGAPGATPAGMPVPGSFPLPHGMHPAGMMGFRGMYAPTPVVAIPKLKPAVKKAEGSEDRKRKQDKKECGATAKGQGGDAKKTEAGKGKKPRVSAPASKASVAVLGVFGFLMIMSPLLPSNFETRLQPLTHSTPVAAHRSWSPFPPAFSGANWQNFWRSVKHEEHSPHGRLLMSVTEEGGRVEVNSSSSGHKRRSSGQQLRGRSSVPAWPADKPIPLPASSVQDSRAKLRVGLNGTQIADTKGELSSRGVPLPATLVLPGEKGGEVEIDGHLIVRAVMAGNSAAASVRGQVLSPSAAIPLGPVEGNADTQAGGVARMIKGGSGETVAGGEGPNAGAVLLPHQLKYLAEGSVQAESSASRMWALPEKASPFGSEGTESKKGSQRVFSSGFKGSFIGSEMCTEVFQFEVKRFAKPGGDNSPMNASRGAARGNSTATDNAGNAHSKTVPDSRRLGSRSTPLNSRRSLPARDSKESRVVDSTALPPVLATVEATEDASQQSQSMVVSILAGVENGEAEVNAGGIGKIFVVVLVEGIKYVTYACHMPSFSGARGASLIPV